VNSFVLLAEDLPKFVRMLRIVDMTSGGAESSLKLIIRMERSPTLSVQKIVLEPFRCLTSQPDTSSSTTTSSLTTRDKLVRA